MADDEIHEDEAFEEDAEPVVEDVDPNDLDEDALEADDDFVSLDDAELVEHVDEADDAPEQQVAAEEPPLLTPAAEEEDDDEDLVDPDDVEADLDTILKDRLVAAEEAPEEDEEEVELDDRADPSERLAPRRSDEVQCPACFLLVRRSAPACPIGDDDNCPIFS